jgi:hypothetical protein
MADEELSCFYCETGRVMASQLPCQCSDCGTNLTKRMADMTGEELSKAVAVKLGYDTEPKYTVAC